MSLLIIWRIVRGQGWTKSMDTELVSAAMSSLDTRAGPLSQPNVIQSEVLSMRLDEAEEGSIRRTEDERKFSFHEAGEV